MAALRPRRACDQCHAVKEKCRRPTDSDTCERCWRLKKDCRNHRPLGKVGRKPRYTRASVQFGHFRCLPAADASPFGSNDSYASSPTEMSYTLSDRGSPEVPRAMTLFPDLNTLEKHLLDMTFRSEMPVDHFVLGPSFHQIHQQSILHHLSAAMPILNDAFIACAGLIVPDRAMQRTAASQQICHRRAASALSSLRSLTVFHEHDIPTVLLLGMVMSTFALHVASDEAFVIARYTLGQIKPTFEASPTQLDVNGQAYLNCLLYTEIAKCLMTCRIPTIRLEEEVHEASVDRFIGLCSPMLTYFYDICKLGYTFRHPESDEDCVKAAQSLRELQRAVDRWQPSAPSDLLTRYAPGELVLILTQVKVHRLTALLIIHRLRHPYGISDGQALAMSNAILTELELARTITNRCTPCTDVAFMAACFEVMDTEERVAALDKADRLIGFSEHVRSKIKAVLASFWTARDRYPPLYWFEVGSYLSVA